MASIINATTTAGVSVQGDNSGSLQLATNNGTTAVTIDTSQNVGIGTSSPAAPIDVVSNSSAIGLSVRGRSDNAGVIRWMSNDGTTVNGRIQVNSGGDMIFQNTNSITERMRIASDGAVLIGKTIVDDTTEGFIYRAGKYLTLVRDGACPLNLNRLTDNGEIVQFRRSTTQVGSVTVTASATAYNTSSDYRLKENIAPMTGALAKVSALKPVTYTWKEDGTDGQGFIAHELQAVVPDCVVGEKDAVETYTDEDGNEQTRIKPQGVDTSFLVATLTAAIQELKAELDATKAEVQALKGVA